MLLEGAQIVWSLAHDRTLYKTHEAMKKEWEEKLMGQKKNNKLTDGRSQLKKNLKEWRDVFFEEKGYIR